VQQYLTRKKRHIGVSLVFAALIQIVLGLAIVYGGITLYSFNLVFFTLVFPANSIEQTLAVVLGALFFSSGLMTAGLSKRFL
jgi:type IV secretory pathway VirB3-like protein